MTLILSRKTLSACAFLFVSLLVTCQLVLAKAIPATPWARKPLTLNGMFSDHMVLQCNQPVTIWGTGTPNDSVGIKVGEGKGIAKVDSKGEWKMTLQPLSPGGPYELLAVDSHEKLTVKDVYAGEVWLCSGQTNMTQTIKETEKELPAELDSRIRFVQVPTKIALVPQKDFNAQWNVLDRSNVENFPSLPYHFASRINKELNVPVGVIICAVPGSPIEAWMSREALNTFPEGRDLIPNIQEQYIQALKAIAGLRPRSNGASRTAPSASSTDALKTSAFATTPAAVPASGTGESTTAPQAVSDNMTLENVANALQNSSATLSTLATGGNGGTAVPTAETGALGASTAALTISGATSATTGASSATGGPAKALIQIPLAVLVPAEPKSVPSTPDVTSAVSSTTAATDSVAATAASSVATTAKTSTSAAAKSAAKTSAAKTSAAKSSATAAKTSSATAAKSSTAPGSKTSPATVAKTASDKPSDTTSSQAAKKLDLRSISNNKVSATTSLFNGMLAPIVPYSVRGFLWYQGEANFFTKRFNNYHKYFAALVRDWRGRWQPTNSPAMLYVQLPAFGKRDPDPSTKNQFADMRERQAQGCLVPSTYMVVTLDGSEGETPDFDDTNKTLIAERLALTALATQYNKKCAYRGPSFDSATIEGNKLRLHFRHATNGLKVKGDKLKGFAIAGDSKQPYWADGSIEGDSVVLSCPEVLHPNFVMYAWQSNPEANLYNGADLPAAPFKKHVE